MPRSLLPRARLVALLIVVLTCLPARADPLTPEKRADIEHLLEMTHALDMGKQLSAGQEGIEL